MLKKNKNKLNKGFTLIELLVVISIISFMSSIVFASVSSARAKARNAARLQAVQTLENAFYLALSSSGFPLISSTTDTPSAACVSATCTGFFAAYAGTTTANTKINTFLSTNLSQKPTDPLDSTRAFSGQSFSGFLYQNPTVATGINGPAISFYLEPGGSCGRAVNAGPGPTFTNCILLLY
jgi:prepilin-type N-terminal cleavage/methylation domain-containing protein